MTNAKRLLHLIVLFGALVGCCKGVWQPSYTPYTTLIGVSNSTFSITLKYRQWQGYFSNVVSLPAGHLAGFVPPAS